MLAETARGLRRALALLPGEGVVRGRKGVCGGSTCLQAPLVEPLNLFARAAITKCHRLGGLNNSNLFSSNSGGWKSKIRESTVLVSPEASHLGMEMA